MRLSNWQMGLRRPAESGHHFVCKTLRPFKCTSVAVCRCLPTPFNEWPFIHFINVPLPIAIGVSVRVSIYQPLPIPESQFADTTPGGNMTQVVASVVHNHQQQKLDILLTDLALYCNNTDRIPLQQYNSNINSKTVI